MTEATKKPAPKKAAPKAEKAAAPKAEAKKPAAKKEAPSGKTVTVTQVIGSIARERSQHATLIGLGLGKRHRTRTLKDSPEVRGMIYKVRHLIKVEG